MKKCILFLLLFVAGFQTLIYAQTFEKPDYKKIEAETKNTKSAFYYPALIKRYKGYDTTFTPEEFVYLYYGSLYNHSHSIWGSSDDNKKLRNILSKDNLTEADLDTLMILEKGKLEEDPFSIRDMNTLAYCYEKKGYKDSSVLTDYRSDKVIRTILSSGDGKSGKTGFHITTVSHEYDMLRALGLRSGGQSLVGNCDVLHVKENDRGIKDVYFDATKILEAEMNLFKH